MSPYCEHPPCFLAHLLRAALAPEAPEVCLHETNRGLNALGHRRCPQCGVWSDPELWDCPGCVPWDERYRRGKERTREAEERRDAAEADYEGLEARGRPNDVLEAAYRAWTQAEEELETCEDMLQALERERYGSE